MAIPPGVFTPGFGPADFGDEANAAATDTALAIAGGLLTTLGAFAGEIQALRGALDQLGSFLRDLFGRVLKVLRHLHLGGFRSFLRHLWDWSRKLADLIRRVLGPIICTIQAIIDYENTLFDTYLRPILILLQRVRSALVLFRLFHLKFASRLDARLAELEAKLVSSFLLVLREINTLRQTLSLFIDPFGIFNPQVIAGAVLRSIGDIWNALHVIQERPLAASERDAQGTDKHLFTRANVSVKTDLPFFRELEDHVAKELAAITGS